MSDGLITSIQLRALATRAEELANLLESQPPLDCREKIEPFLEERSRRRKRASLLPADLFREPAWDMLIDLMIAQMLGKQVSIRSLCHAAGVPATTALRHIATLEARGLIRREADTAMTDGAAYDD